MKKKMSDGDGLPDLLFSKGNIDRNCKIKILPHCMFPIRIVKNSLHDPFIFIKKMKPTAPVPYEPLFEAFHLVEKIEAVQTSTKGVE